MTKLAVKVRLREATIKRLQVAAERNDRSLNMEIAHRLEASLDTNETVAATVAEVLAQLLTRGSK